MTLGKQESGFSSEGKNWWKEPRTQNFPRWWLGRMREGVSLGSPSQENRELRGFTAACGGQFYVYFSQFISVSLGSLSLPWVKGTAVGFEI